MNATSGANALIVNESRFRRSEITYTFLNHITNIKKDELQRDTIDIPTHDPNREISLHFFLIPFILFAIFYRITIFTLQTNSNTNN